MSLSVQPLCPALSVSVVATAGANVKVGAAVWSIASLKSTVTMNVAVPASASVTRESLTATSTTIGSVASTSKRAKYTSSAGSRAMPS